MHWVFLASLGLVGVALTGLVLVSLAAAAFRRNLRRQARQLLAGPGAPAARIVAESELAGLPAPVQRWLRAAGVVGRPLVQTVRLRQRGEFRLAAGKPWLPFTAEQYYSVDPPQFAWYVRMRMGGLPLLSGGDTYLAGRGRLTMRIAELFTVADATGPQLDASELVRWLSEIIWFPVAALSPAITWEAVDARHARATLRNGSQEVSGVFRFDADGRVEGFTAQRYMGVRANPPLETWDTPVAAWSEFRPVLDGPAVELPSRASVRWLLASSELEYAKVEITAIEYNPEGMY
jgi:hypothetical protein